MRFFVLFSVISLFGASLYAQQKTITGTVTDTNGEPLIGASILVKGNTQGTVTNIDGKYTLSLSADAKVLIFRSVGMVTKELPITGSIINVTLSEDQKTLDEVVVIGYGTVKRKDLVASVSSVDEKALKDIPVATVSEALTGKLPGVQVTTTEGSPDAEIKIRVRGGGSITQSNTPLYIVDGFAKDNITIFHLLILFRSMY
ncbi:MAG: carboxypeptidase-like regulatory domain-containing protein [Paludibacteraceae bacterium]